MGNRRDPNFFIVGTAKAGTTSLYEYLSRHPEVFVSPMKEPHYLALEEGKFVANNGYKNTARSIRSYPPVIQTEKQYRDLFSGVTNERALGEASTLYLYSKWAPQRIAHRYPDAKIIILLRNPVDRAYSQFLHHVRDGHETTSDFWEAFSNEKERLSRGPFWHYRRMGLYCAQVQQYVERFDEDQIHIVRFKEIKRNMSTVLRDILSFLEVDDAVENASVPVRNKTGMPRRGWLNYLLFLARRYPLLRRITPLIPDALRKQVRAFRNRNLYKPELEDEVRAKCMSLFIKDIEQLEALLDCDLSDWRHATSNRVGL
jgi:hypothetical protein